MSKNEKRLMMVDDINCRKSTAEIRGGGQSFCMCGPTKILILLRRPGLQQAYVIASKTDKVPEKQVN